MRGFYSIQEKIFGVLVIDVIAFRVGVLYVGARHKEHGLGYTAFSPEPYAFSQVI